MLKENMGLVRSMCVSGVFVRERGVCVRCVCVCGVCVRERGVCVCVCVRRSTHQVSLEIDEHAGCHLGNKDEQEAGEVLWRA